MRGADAVSGVEMRLEVADASFPLDRAVAWSEEQIVRRYGT